MHRAAGAFGVDRCVEVANGCRGQRLEAAVSRASTGRLPDRQSSAGERGFGYSLDQPDDCTFRSLSNQHQLPGFDNSTTDTPQPGWLSAFASYASTDSVGGNCPPKPVSSLWRDPPPAKGSQADVVHIVGSRFGVQISRYRKRKPGGKGASSKDKALSGECCCHGVGGGASVFFGQGSRGSAGLSRCRPLRAQSGPCRAGATPLGRSRRYADAPSTLKELSFLSQTIRIGGWNLRNYACHSGWRLTFEP